MKKRKPKNRVREVVSAALFLALALLLPFVTGQIKDFSKMFCPMHLPVLLAGVVSGPFWGGLVGLCAPLLRSVLFGMPQMPTTLTMTAELFGYGVLSGFFYRLFPKKISFLLLSLILSFVGGRLLLTSAQLIVYGLSGKAFSFGGYFTANILATLPGMALQIIAVPALLPIFKKKRK
ncbi:MAG: ECF transporter S component [Clostridia bacterium]|nr:ECF transporter S component [Clostridia bacterium]